MTQDLADGCRLKGDLMTVLTMKFISGEVRFFAIEPCRNADKCRMTRYREGLRCDQWGYSPNRPFYIRVNRQQGGLTEDERKGAKALPTHDELNGFVGKTE